MRLLRRLVLRPLWRDPLRSLLTILAVALGVAVVVAMDLAGDAATGSFRASLETLTGKTDFEIHANGGIDEPWIGRLAALPTNAVFSPWVESQARIPEAGSVPLYGADMIAAAFTAELRGSHGGPPAANGIVITESLAKRLHATAGGMITLLVKGAARQFPIVGALDAGPSEYVVMDIALAQKLLGRVGKLDRIDVIAGPREDAAQLEAEVRKLLPPGYRLERPGARGEENQRMLRAFRWNLRVLSYMSLVVGAFLIYNTIAIGVVRRRAEIGVLRALGATRRSVFTLFLTEALALGLAGAALGIALGRGLAELLVTLVSSTVNSLYATSRPAPVELTWTEALIALAAAALAAVASAFARRVKLRKRTRPRR